MRRTPLTALAVATAAAVGLGAWQGPRLLGEDDGDRRAARAYATAWTGGTLAALRWAPGADDPAGQVAALTAGLTPAESDRPAEVLVRSVQRDGDRATARLAVRWDLGTPWEHEAALPLRRVDDVWRPVLALAAVHPALRDGERLRSRTVQPPRAAITDLAGTPLVTARPVVTVGLQPSRAPDLAVTARQVAALTDVEEAGLLARARSARPDAFVEVVTLRRDAYDAVRDRLRPVPGVVLREGTRQLAPTAAFARALLGSVGPATAELVEQGGGRVRPDQEVGLSGLQRSQDARLAGTAGVTVERLDAAGDAAEVLHRTEPVPGRPLAVTLDADVQQAADLALAGAPAGKGSALVAVRVSTGDVLAVANDGPQGPTVDRALTGRYPPGSTFKVATTLALLRGGLRPGTTVPCPATLSVQGKAFKNAEDEVLGQQPFSTSFALSCNTAFVGSATRVSSAELTAAATDLGSSGPDLGVPAFGGQVPTTADAVEHAAQAIGQGRVLASPLSAAVTAATVAGGRLRPPRLLGDAPARPPGPVLPEAAALQALTRQVVTGGTATVLRDAPGGPVSGKTGTAEFGTEVPPRTHAWFAGSQGDVAFAVLVEDGGFGGRVAAPLARSFLTALRQPRG